MKRCPFCAEEIQDEAIVCKHCHRNLPGPSSTNKSDTKFIRKLLLYAGAALVLLWIVVAFKERAAKDSPKANELNAGISSNRAVLDDRGNAACVDFGKLRSEGEKSFALNMINLGSNASHSSNNDLQRAGKVIALYVICPDNPMASGCRDISKTEMLQALADIETACESVH